MLNKLLEISVMGVAFGLVSCSSPDGVPSSSLGSQVGGTTSASTEQSSEPGETGEAGGSRANGSGGTSALDDDGTGGTSNAGPATGRPKPNGGSNSVGPANGTSGAANTTKTSASSAVPAAGRPGAVAPTGGGRAGINPGASGGRVGMGGAASGGRVGVGNGGAPVFGVPGGSPGKGGAASTSASTTPATGGDVDCSAAMPTGGQQHSGNGRGGTDNLAWEIWSNQGSGSMTTFSTPAFSASWNNSGDYLGRLGYEWGNGSKTYDAYGTITAQFTFKKTGTGGSFSYIGIYGWSTNPCVEWYIIDDSFNAMPFTPYNSSAKGSATMIDGENYKFYSNSTNGTGGSRCNQSSWSQFWSVRQKARQCGTITISDHFKAWDAAGMKLGALLEAKILVETGGGSGTVEFPIAKVSKTQ